MKRIGILTGGGDCPGLNPVIRAVVKTAIEKYNMTVVGFKNGYKGLYNNETVELTLENTSGILHRGGTILYSSNKDNLFDYLVPDENGNLAFHSKDHPATDVLIFAYGQGAELFDGVNIENIQIAHTIAALMGVDNFGDQSVYQSLTKGK